ncbi:NAD(P)-binding domain-containing protein [Labedella populi]
MAELRRLELVSSTHEKQESVVQTIAVLGVGRVGSAVARTALAAGYDTRVAGSGAAEDIELLAEIVIPGARAMTATDAVSDADLVVVAVPLSKYRSVDASMLAGKTVVDAMNYWPPVDGQIADFEEDIASTSEVVSRYFSGSRVVKTLNHIGYHELEDDGAPSGTAGRRALAIASDDEAAAAAVQDVLDRFGFDTVYAGPLATGRAFEPGTAIFNGAFSQNDLLRELELNLHPTH